MRHSYRVWLEPHAGPFVDAAMEKAGPLLQAPPVIKYQLVIFNDYGDGEGLLLQAAQEQVKKLTVSVAPPAKPSAETKKNL